MVTNPHQVIFDLDDFAENDNCLDTLYRMRAHWPDFKVTLFTIPMKCSKEFLRAVKEIPWIQMAIHGWEHTPVECETWSEKEARVYLSNALEWDVFIRGFKAPQWRLAPPIMAQIVNQGDMWLADNADPASNPFGHNKPTTGLMYYYANGDDIVPGVFSNYYHREHGHIGCLDAGNDIRQIFHHLMEKYPRETRFHFVDTVVRKLYAEKK